mmetsp:Transcript_22908/g.55431  ORF Transcript_22908/g.55431 Transcript_22908/m.55431 type:complete len:261 (+) Transcript_22908:668-1450(+)
MLLVEVIGIPQVDHTQEIRLDELCKTNLPTSINVNAAVHLQNETVIQGWRILFEQILELRKRQDPLLFHIEAIKPHFVLHNVQILELLIRDTLTSVKIHHPKRNSDLLLCHVRVNTSHRSRKCRIVQLSQSGCIVFLEGLGHLLGVLAHAPGALHQSYKGVIVLDEHGNIKIIIKEIHPLNMAVGVRHYPLLHKFLNTLMRLQGHAVHISYFAGAWLEELGHVGHAHRCPCLGRQPGVCFGKNIKPHLIQARVGITTKKL